ncbi:hypothetical protein [Ureibacillus massiliensis]|uniref:hypothetical protein n=1 Tax=Ureibacillus massiliensis TaxID=292806 RepID=UPI00068E2E61|nr:hypothetical protein [Ureibacillus massiliensis]
MGKPKQKFNIPTQKRNQSLLKGVSDSPTAKQNEQTINDYFLISLKYLDRTQGQDFSEWEQENLLAKAMETLRNYSHNSLVSQVDGKKFNIYGEFPPKKKTEFNHPKHVPEDAEWARIHVTGKQCIIGFVNRNIFNVVFLDKEHKFWKSEKKHT